MELTVIALDPGETTGYFVKKYFPIYSETYKDHSKGDLHVESKIKEGGTIGRNHLEVFNLLSRIRPDIVILETFNLYPGKAKSLAWNSFYPCEVIGVIKLWVMLQQIQGFEVLQVEQAPSVKKYAGGLREDWQYFQHNMLKEKVTEHVKDAYMHIKYWERYNKSDLPL